MFVKEIGFSRFDVVIDVVHGRYHSNAELKRVTDIETFCCNTLMRRFKSGCRL